MIWFLRNANRISGWTALYGLHHSPYQYTHTHLTRQTVLWTRSLSYLTTQGCCSRILPYLLHCSWCSPGRVCLNLTSLPCFGSSSKELLKYMVSSFSSPSAASATSDQDFAQTVLLKMILSKSPVAFVLLNPVASRLLLSPVYHPSFLGPCRCCVPYWATFSHRCPKWLSPTAF